MSRTTIFSILILIAVLLAGCSFTSNASPTPAGIEETQAAEATLNSQATAEALNTAQALSTQNAQATADAGATTTVVYQQTQDAENTSIARTATQEKKLTATADYIQQATAQAQPMADALQALYDEGIITNMDGTYFRLMDFDQSLAKLNYTYPGDPTGFDVDNFVFKAKFGWNTASDKTNWDRSGCGLIFGYSDFNKFDYVLLSLDGYADLWRPTDDGTHIYPIAKMRYSGKLSIPEGEADVLLVVVNKRIYFYVNGEQVLKAYDAKLVPGPLAYTLISGTNKDYGTRCTMTDVGLWQFSP